MDLSTAIQVAVPVVLVGVWLLRLEGRINTQDALRIALKEDVVGLKADVQYIRARIDQALNGHRAD
jgi:hypothetical protein